MYVDADIGSGRWENGLPEPEAEKVVPMPRPSQTRAEAIGTLLRAVYCATLDEEVPDDIAAALKKLE